MFNAYLCFMETLNRTVKYNGFTYELIRRTRTVAIYAQYSEDEIIAYEVFRIKIQKEATRVIGGVEIHFAEKEKFPNNEAFGYTAFTCGTLEKAEERMREMDVKIQMKNRGIELN